MFKLSIYNTEYHFSLATKVTIGILRLTSWSTLYGIQMISIILFISFLLPGPIWSDHTTLCISIPSLNYKSETFKSMGMEKFPRDDYWKRFQEAMEGGKLVVGSSGGAALANSTRRAGHPVNFNIDTGAYPQGELFVYRIRKNESEILNQWFRVEFAFRANPQITDMDGALKMFILQVFIRIYVIS